MEASNDSLCMLIIYTDPITLPTQDGTIMSVFRGSVQCNGSESSYAGCEMEWTGVCRYHGSGIKCFTGLFIVTEWIIYALLHLYTSICYSSEPECEEGNVQLVESTGNYSTVQFCIYGFWVFIGGNSWDDTDASVICGELGFLILSKHIYLIPRFKT